MSAFEKSEALAITLISFKYGNPASPTFLHLCNSRGAVTFDSITFQPQPLMEINLGERRGTMNEPVTTIRLSLADPVSGAFVTRLSNGEPHSAVSVTIREIVDDGATVDQIYLFVGGIESRHRNDDKNKPNTVLLKCSNVKSDLDVPSGIMVADQCQWVFGHAHTCWKGAAVDFESLRETVTAGAIVGFTITLPGLSSPTFPTLGAVPVTPNAYWRGGFVTRDGISLKIRDFVGGAVFLLKDIAPADWTGQSVVVTPGCTKLIDRCRQWDREGRFMGLATKMPPFQTIAEVG